MFLTKKLEHFVEDEGNYYSTEYYHVVGQLWDKRTLNYLRDHEHVIFMSLGQESVLPIKLFQYYEEGPWLCTIGGEDDGNIFFHKQYDQYLNYFHFSWIDSLIHDLITAKALVGEITGGKK